MQEIRPIALSDLHLWTENPRDQICANLSDSEIIKRAIDDPSNNWALDKLLAGFGETYHQNKLPVVVEVDGSYVVYDGNRRVAMLKCLQNEELYSMATGRLNLIDPPSGLMDIKELPCDVCDLETALDIVEKDHQGAGKWGMLQYEWFLHYHRNKPKGTLMIIEEAYPGAISQTKLNEEYVRTRLLTKANLNEIGLSIEDGHLISVHDQETSKQIIDDLAQARERNLTSHRKNAGDIKAALTAVDPKRYEHFMAYSDDRKTYDITASQKSTPTPQDNPEPPRKPIRRKKPAQLFGGKLYPKGEKSNQLYRALEDIYALQLKNPEKFAHLTPLVAMGLRLLLDTVAREYYSSIGDNSVADDAVYKTFLSKVAKPAFKDNGLVSELNVSSLAADWLDSNYNLEGILGKWAHGSMTSTLDDVLKASNLVGEIIRITWSDR